MIALLTYFTPFQQYYERNNFIVTSVHRMELINYKLLPLQEHTYLCEQGDCILSV